jgi:hypothetical protein
MVTGKTTTSRIAHLPLRCQYLYFGVIAGVLLGGCGLDGSSKMAGGKPNEASSLLISSIDGRGLKEVLWISRSTLTAAVLR